MNRQDQSFPPFLKCILISVMALLFILGITLIYDGIHRGVIHQEIVNHPATGAWTAAYGARAVKIGIFVAVLGIVFIYVAAFIFCNLFKGTRGPAPRK